MVRGFWVREPHRVRLITPYSKEFINALKAAVPYRYLTFDGEARTWVARQPYVDAALEVASEFYEMTPLYASQDAPPSSSSSSSSSSPPSAHPVEECLRRVQAMWREHATLYVLPHAPWTVVEAAKRAMAHLVHPDKGGTHERMVEVNLAYEKLRDQHERAEQRRSSG